MRTDRRQTELERALRRRDEAAPGSPEWDAAAEAVLQLETHEETHAGRGDHSRRRLFLVEARSGSSAS